MSDKRSYHTASDCIHVGCFQKHYQPPIVIDFQVEDEQLTPVGVMLVDDSIAGDDTTDYFYEEWRLVGLDLFPPTFKQVWSDMGEDDNGKTITVKGRLWTQLVSRNEDDSNDYEVGFEFADD